MANRNGQKILLLCGSLNQTSQMHQVALELGDFDCWFSQLFSEAPLICAAQKYTNLVDMTILGGNFRKNSEQYLRENFMQIDYAAKQNNYDLVIFCSDMVVPRRLRKHKTIWVQEGMTDPPTWKSQLVKHLGLPGYFAGDTSLNGSSNICDVYCAASEGYKTNFSRTGTEEERIIVTGIPNYDNIRQFLNNDFPHHGHVMVATSDIRETLRKEDRPAFLQNCTKIAAGRRLIFKLHPNELKVRAVAEIKENTPADTLIFTDGNINHMIANSSELITQFSTVVYVGLGLGLPVHSYFDVQELNRLAPIQNGGNSAKNIAKIARDFVAFNGNKKDFVKQYHFTPYTTASQKLAMEMH